ncbi:MAG: extensin family protein [Deltaproteobacteria bacterium]|nr:MAG: extensin family protein [Deltaproteobacteria bacterium]TMQ24746.1 MAG: extensin family protein [Deltaproteobacteria bacterium]
MSRRRIAAGLLAGVALASAAAADPAPTSRSKAKSTSTPRGKAKVARRSGVAKANGNNMPRGFTWPPSRAMLAAEADCERSLDAAGVAWHATSRDGRIVDAVTIDDAVLGGIAYTPAFGKGPYKLDCQLALALATIGPDLAAAGVREVRFGSIYRWSNVRVGGKTKNALSRHALGLAMDVVSFVDESGREAKVARDYRAGDDLLLDVERTINASSSFRLVLTPKNDPISHSDHFHLEANPSYAVTPRS